MELASGTSMLERPTQGVHQAAPAEDAGSEPETAIRCRGLAKSFGTGETRVHALRGVDLEVMPGSITLLVGPSGCGKTTLISIIAGLLDPTEGSLNVLGQELTALPPNDLVDFRARNLGFVFQQYNLLPSLNAVENACLPLLVAGVPRRTATGRVRGRCWSAWAWRRRPKRFRRSFPAASSSGWPSPAHSCTSRDCSSATSRRPPSTRTPGRP